MKIYLDVCCLNRPFDDQSQNRVRLESEAVLSILEMAQSGRLEITGSDVIEYEISQMPDHERLEKVKLLLDLASSHSPLTLAVERRATQLAEWNIAPLDALHLASAESTLADYLLTTDDALLSKAFRCQSKLKVKVENPAKWLIDYR